MAHPRSHQTVRLAAGSHGDPGAGVCVVELASMLADEPFSAYPSCVCPVIAAFMRTYNDLVDDRRRQDLLPYAAAVVGTRATESEERTRARLCRAWVTRIAAPAFLQRPFWTTLSLNRAVRNGAAATYAAMVAVNTEVPGERHRSALALIDELLAVPTAPPTLTIPDPDESEPAARPVVMGREN